MERGMSYKRNVVVYIVISLDGYIATKDDSLEWLLNTQGSGDNGFGEFYDTVETIIMGKRTYDWIMNQEWSELNKTMQLQLKKKDSFEAGISTLLELRKALMEQILQFKEDLSPEDFTAMPYPNANGYHSKTIAYSLWHIFRIEDIVAHSLKSLTFQDTKEKITDEKRKNLELLHVVSEDETACWLIDYWCKKDVKGLVQMPFSRHWIMHIEACLRIRDKQCPK